MSFFNFLKGGKKSIRKYIKNKLTYDEYHSLINIKYFFREINWIKTIWFNFKALPFSQAKKLPFILSYNVKVKSIGKIELTGDVHIGMVSVGVVKISDYSSNSNPFFFTNKGTIKIKGNVKFQPGIRLYIAPNACISLGRRITIGFNNKIFCYKSITIGDDFRMSWEGQLFDTDFHFLYNILSDKYYPRIKPVVIGDSVFIGNRCTVGKGTVIPNGSVISCVSKVSGDFSEKGENLLITGNPATVIKVGISMGNSWYPEREVEISKMMNE